MPIQTAPTEFVADGRRLRGVFVASPQLMPAVLLVHGWDSDQAHYEARADRIAALGCACLAFDLRGHGSQSSQHHRVSRADNLRDVLAAYDLLVRQDGVDPRSIAMVGTSYGGYLAAIACSLRPVRWLALRVPALYPDDQWSLPKERLDRKAVAQYRQEVRAADANRALAACAVFTGDALVVQSELDDVVAPPAIASYVAAFQRARSLTYRCIAGADHALSGQDSQDAYDALFTSWLTEMLLHWRSE
jgi:pimeloyl-ACP methyl ester carboxylesterase